MKALDSPLEALALSPVNLSPLLTAAINSLWAWLAVVTAAAFSFWRLRTSSIKLHSSPPPEPSTTPSSSTRDSATATTSFGGQKKEDARDSTPATTSFRGEKKREEEEGVLTRGDSFKNRFTVYYEEEREKGRVDDVDDDVDGGDEAVLKRWATGLTVDITRRDLRLGWYGFQDRRVIDGSVVRLWEEERESSSPRRCRRRSHGRGGTTPLIFS